MFSIQELRSSTTKELLQELEKARKESLKVRINIKTKQEKDGSKSKKTKRYIAKILTVLKEVEAEEGKKSNEKKSKLEKVEDLKSEEDK